MPDYNQWNATELHDMVRQRTGIDHRIRRNKAFFIDILQNLDHNAVFPVMDTPPDIRAMIFEILPSRTQLALARTSKTVSREVLPFLYNRQIELRLEVSFMWFNGHPINFGRAPTISYTLGRRRYARCDQRGNALDPFKHHIIPIETLLQIKKLRISVVFDSFCTEASKAANRHLYALAERLIDSRQLREIQVDCTSRVSAMPYLFIIEEILYPVTRLSACPRKPQITFSGLINNNARLQQCLAETVPTPRRPIQKCRLLADIARGMKERLNEVHGRDHILDVFALGCEQMMLLLESGVINRDRDIEISRARSALLRYYAQHRQHLEGLEEVRRARMRFTAVAGIWP